MGPSTFPCMPVTSHAAINSSVIRCPFNSWKSRGVVRCSLHTCSLAMLHWASTVSLPSISIQHFHFLCFMRWCFPTRWHAQVLGPSPVSFFTPTVLSVSSDAPPKGPAQKPPALNSPLPLSDTGDFFLHGQCFGFSPSCPPLPRINRN